MKRGGDVGIQIGRLVDEVQNLSLELSEAKEELRKLQERMDVDDAAHLRKNRNNKEASVGKGKRKAFQIGDRVVIIDNYRGNKGKKGTIVGVTGQQVILQLEHQELQVRKWKENVRKVNFENKVCER